MITAVDTNVLLDILIPSDQHGPQSKAWLVAAYDAGAIVVSDVVYAELVPSFRDRATLDGALQEIGATPRRSTHPSHTRPGYGGSGTARQAGLGSG